MLKCPLTGHILQIRWETSRTYLADHIRKYSAYLADQMRNYSRISRISNDTLDEILSCPLTVNQMSNRNRMPPPNSLFKALVRDSGGVLGKAI
jgi:hypothetical protein